MKRRVILIVSTAFVVSSIIMLLITPIRCEKELIEYCWECEVHAIFPRDPDGSRIESIRHFAPRCDADYLDIEEWERHNTYKDSTVTQWAVCYRKEKQ